MATNEKNRNDLVLLPRHYAIIKDTTKGNLGINVGPLKVTLGDSDTPMIPDPHQPGRLIEAPSQDSAILPYIDVGESEYVVLNNPPRNNTNPELLKVKSTNDMADLAFGRKINIPGPISFPLFPYQFTTVIPGHLLQMNQYLVVKVVNDTEALANWNKGVVKTVDATTDAAKTEEGKGKGAKASAEKKGLQCPTSLSVGQLIIIKGTEVSFYIPPTGLEVVKDSRGGYVRDAVTLEQLEYCVLVDQNGNKRYERGPAVVFPTATEEFIETDGSKRANAIELTKISGLHIKVTAPYKDADGEHKEGDELFITGDKQPIYFPRAEHSIVKYSDRQRHHATAIPKGEGRYVLDRLSGGIRLARGPEMLLPDPRNEVIVQRILSETQVSLWYPGNSEAMSINVDRARKAASQKEGSGEYLAYSAETMVSDADYLGATRGVRARSAATTSKFVGDQMSRSETYTPPRTLTLNTKYDGAVQVDVWTGYAVLVVDKTGKRRVEVGPATLLLEFDEQLASMEFSTGKPKTTDRLFKTAYLRVLNNFVSDIITAQTADDIKVDIKVSYRINFKPEYKEKWFDAENYVKLVCDHARSRLRNAVKKIGIQDFTDKYIDLVRDTILGPSVTTEGAKKGRTGLTFQENGAHVYDVEVLGLDIGDKDIAGQLLLAQRNTIGDALRLSQSKRQLVLAEEQETINQKLETVRTNTAIQKIQLQRKVADETAGMILAALGIEEKKAKTQQVVEVEVEKVADIGLQADLDRRKLRLEQELHELTSKSDLKAKELVAETNSVKERLAAITPPLVTAINHLGDKNTMRELAASAAPAAWVGGKPIIDAINQMVKGLGFDKFVGGMNRSTELEDEFAKK